MAGSLDHSTQQSSADHGGSDQIRSDNATGNSGATVLVGHGALTVCPLATNIVLPVNTWALVNDPTFQTGTYTKLGRGGQVKLGRGSSILGRVGTRLDSLDCGALRTWVMYPMH